MGCESTHVTRPDQAPPQTGRGFVGVRGGRNGARGYFGDDESILESSNGGISAQPCEWTQNTEVDTSNA